MVELRGPRPKGRVRSVRRLNPVVAILAGCDYFSLVLSYVVCRPRTTTVGNTVIDFADSVQVRCRSM